MRLLRLLLATLALVFAAGLHAAPPPPPAAIQAGVPPEAFTVLAYVRKHREAPPGYVGGRRFGNFEGRLPKMDARGRRLAYQEWDIFPKRPGRNRGPQRLVTGSDGRAWYTADHYDSFLEIRERR
ncbi:MAG: ribonuclease domain-containing protein [Holophagaceae bacterium]